jgi:hypothetical protein
VEGPFIGETYYTCTAKPGMKFVIIFFEFKNNGVREQETPYINEGEISTSKGYFYSIWSAGFAHDNKEYNRRESTNEEIEKLTGNSGGFSKLLPEQSVKGCVVFEIPENLIPTEAKLKIGYNPYTIIIK